MITQKGPFLNALFRAGRRYKQLLEEKSTMWRESDKNKVALMAGMECGLDNGEGSVEPPIVRAIRLFGDSEDRDAMEAAIHAFDQAWKAHGGTDS